MLIVHDKPCAAPGLISYRYPQSFKGFVMIGAKDHADALNEARRTLGYAEYSRLEVWDGARYVPAFTSKVELDAFLEQNQKP